MAFNIVHAVGAMLFGGASAAIEKLDEIKRDERHAAMGALLKNTTLSAPPDAGTQIFDTLRGLPLFSEGRTWGLDEVVFGTYPDSTLAVFDHIDHFTKGKKGQTVIAVLRGAHDYPNLALRPHGATHPALLRGAGFSVSLPRSLQSLVDGYGDPEGPGRLPRAVEAFLRSNRGLQVEMRGPNLLLYRVGSRIHPTHWADLAVWGMESARIFAGRASVDGLPLAPEAAA